MLWLRAICVHSCVWHKVGLTHKAAESPTSGRANWINSITKNWRLLRWDKRRHSIAAKWKRVTIIKSSHSTGVFVGLAPFHGRLSLVLRLINCNLNILVRNWANRCKRLKMHGGKCLKNAVVESDSKPSTSAVAGIYFYGLRQLGSKLLINGSGGGKWSLKRHFSTFNLSCSSERLVGSEWRYFTHFAFPFSLVDFKVLFALTFRMLTHCALIQ